MTIIERANERAQRRLRDMLTDFFATGSWDGRLSRLYSESDRLVAWLEDEARWEERKADYDLWQTADHDGHDERQEPETCGICARELDSFLRFGMVVPESEARALWGDR